MARPPSNVIGFDDGPFEKGAGPAEVLLVGTVFARTRLDGVLCGQVQRDGDDATVCMASLLTASPFDGHVRAILLQGIAVAGLNIVEIHKLAAQTARPVVVVARRPPDLPAMKRALTHVAAGDEKWALIEAAGPMEHLNGVYVQRAGISAQETSAVLKATTLHGHLPEPLRVAHLIAGGLARGRSRGRA